MPTTAPSPPSATSNSAPARARWLWLEIDDAEGDDAVATLICRATGQDRAITVMSGDRYHHSCSTTTPPPLPPAPALLESLSLW